MPKKAAKVVKGPQLPLIPERTQIHKGDGEPSGKRARYIEPPTKKDGNPFVAFRCPAELRDAFVKLAKGRGTTPPAMLRAYLAKATGVKLEVADGE